MILVLIPTIPALVAGVWLAFLKDRPYDTAAPAELERAHLAGKWFVTFTPESTRDIELPPLYTAQWEFSPRCASGPCETLVVDNTEGRGALGTLVPDGAAYRLTATLPDPCDPEGGGPSHGFDERVELVVVPTKARETSDGLRAVAFRGTEDATFTPTPQGVQAGCVGGAWRASFVAVPAQEPFFACDRVDELLVRFSELCYLLS